MKEHRCPECNKKLIRYTNGRSYGCCESYPYESGYYCPDKCISYSDLQITRGVLEEQK